MGAGQPKASWWRVLSIPRSAIRTEEVVPPSQRDDGSWVFLAAMAIVVCVIYIIGFERGGPVGGNAAAPAQALLPYQVLFRDLPGTEQRMFRAMQEGLGEALRTRGSTQNWPAVATLSADGVPPFAPDVLDRSGLRWELRSTAFLYQYVGVPSATRAAPAFMISIVEPEPIIGEKAIPGVVDEEHQVLPDGLLLHITYWKRGAVGIGAGPITDPSLAGWTQIRVKSPIEELTESS
jgi:hypothetical protein